jgi:2-C-methyl-D-erythritol 4-phosphate cytidylyltransferase
VNIALLTAAGSGSRTHQDIPKQFIHINNKPIIIYTMEAFQIHPSIDKIIVVGLKGWIDILWAYAKQFNIDKLEWVVEGGETGQDSIKNALLELEKTCNKDDTILIHDGNRPMVSQDIITDSIVKYKKYGSAVSAIPCVEAIFRSKDGFTSNTSIPREELYKTHTPHVYSLSKLLWAHQKAAEENVVNTAATCTLMNRFGEAICFSLGSEKNIKITTAEDIEIFKALLISKNDEWIKNIR